MRIMSNQEIRLISEIKDETVSLPFLKQVFSALATLCVATAMIIWISIWAQDFRKDSLFSPTTGQLEKTQSTNP